YICTYAGRDDNGDELFYIYSDDYKEVYVGTLKADFTRSTIEYIEDFDISKGYSFAGWYSQSYNRSNNAWSNFELITTDMTKPFITAATADTNIVALFVALTEFSFSYDPNEFTVTFRDSLDSRGDPININESNYSKLTKNLDVYGSKKKYFVLDAGEYKPYTYNAGDWSATDGKLVSDAEIYEKLTTISGWFYYSSAPVMSINPVGGYRVNDTYQVSIDGGTFEAKEFDGSLTYYQTYTEKKATETTFTNWSMTSDTFVKFPLVKLTLGNAGGEVESRNSCAVKLSAKEVIFTSFEINGFTYTNSTGATVNDCSFVIFSVTSLGALDKVFYTSDYSKDASGVITSDIKDAYLVSEIDEKGFYTNEHYSLNRDIAHNELYHSKETDGTHKVYGWFDYSYNGRLVAAIIYNIDHEVGGSSTSEEFQEWKTNGAITSTDFTSMFSAVEYESIMKSLFKVSTEEYQTLPKEKISFETAPDTRYQINKSYYFTGNEAVDKNCALTEYGQVIHHSIGRDIVTDIKIMNEFVQVDSANAALEPVDTNVIVPIDMTYYMNYNKFTGGQLIAQNGFLAFNYDALNVAISPSADPTSPDKTTADDLYRINLDEN
ncbi:MAG: hypothetical protein IKA31_04905, partial [Clostridia bacterium]|nr:hypothetical protein [Clostridia bacterium]